MILTVACLLGCDGAFASEPQRTNLRLRVRIDGPPPPPASLLSDGDVAYCGDPSMIDERLIVDPASGGIANVIVWCDQPEGETDGHQTSKDREAKLVSIESRGCRFSPHVLLCRQGDTLQLVNHDVLGHVFQANFFRNEMVAVALSPRRNELVNLEHAEPQPINVECQIFPWMKAYVMVVDHGRAGVTDQQGIIEIENLPVGQRFQLRLWHESATLDRVTFAGKNLQVERGKIEIQLSASKSEQGREVELRIPSTAFAEPKDQSPLLSPKAEIKSPAISESGIKKSRPLSPRAE